MRDLHAAVEFAGDHAHERQGVAVVFVHAGLNLEHHAGEVVADFALLVNRGGGRLHSLRVGRTALGCRGDGAQRVQDLVHAEVQHRGGEDDRRGDALLEELLIVHGAVFKQQRRLLDGGVPHVAFLARGLVGGVVLLRSDGGAAGGAGEVHVPVDLAVA